MSAEPTVVVLAKAPVPGRAKTRLSPPCTADAAAAIAEAALFDTLEAVERWGGRRVLALDACGTDFAVHGWPTIAQPSGGLGERLQHVLGEVLGAGAGPVFLVAMDTPQVTAEDLDAGLAALLDGSADATIGPATDGGYWGIGVAQLPRGSFEGVEMSTSTTGTAQIARLRALGLRVDVIHELMDMDTFADVEKIAANAPLGRVASIASRPDWWTDAALQNPALARHR